jgi:hypothetical protein
LPISDVDGHIIIRKLLDYVLTYFRYSYDCRIFYSAILAQDFSSVRSPTKSMTYLVSESRWTLAQVPRR